MVRVNKKRMQMIDKNKLSNSEQASPKVGASSEKFIDIYDLWNMLVRWKEKVIIVAFVTFVVIVANAYLYTSMPVYKSTVHLSKPLQEDIKGLDSSPEKVFAALAKTLESRSLRWRYFNENKLFEKLASDKYLDEATVFEEKFNKLLSVYFKGNQARVSFEGVSNELVAESLNSFVMLANEETAKRFVDAHIFNIQSKRDKKAAENQLAKLSLEQRITKFEEAALIAELAGIKDIMLNWHPDHLFTMGSKVLRAKIKVLRNRKSDVYNFPNADLSHVSTVKVTQIATVSSHSLKEHDFKLVILTGLLSALVLGLLTAFFADFIVRAREKQQSVD
jgi:LPS O-antigen subunit length determinant protein (WzzB/FepE family)